MEMLSSIFAENDCFLASNERVVLPALGDHAWPYRMLVDGDGNDCVANNLQNLMSHMEHKLMLAMVWRVGSKAASGT